MKQPILLMSALMLVGCQPKSEVDKCVDTLLSKNSIRAVKPVAAGNAEIERVQQPLSSTSVDSTLQRMVEGDTRDVIRDAADRNEAEVEARFQCMQLDGGKNKQ